MLLPLYIEGTMRNSEVTLAPQFSARLQFKRWKSWKRQRKVKFIIQKKKLQTPHSILCISCWIWHNLETWQTVSIYRRNSSKAKKSEQLWSKSWTNMTLFSVVYGQLFRSHQYPCCYSHKSQRVLRLSEDFSFFVRTNQTKVIFGRAHITPSRLTYAFFFGSFF